MPVPRTLVLAAAALTLTACSGSGGSGSDAPTLGRAAVEAQARTELGNTVGREPEEVTCPGDLVGTVGETMRCMLSDSGTTLGVTITVTGVQGTDVAFGIEVDDLGENG